MVIIRKLRINGFKLFVKLFVLIISKLKMKVNVVIILLIKLKGVFLIVGFVEKILCVLIFGGVVLKCG